MNARKSEGSRNEPSFVKGVALVATGLVVTLGAGALIVSSQGDKTRTNASRPTWASERSAKSPRSTAKRSVATATPASAAVPAATTPTASAPAAVVSEPTRSEPVTWAEAQAAWDAGDWSAATDLYAGYVEGHPGNPWGHYMKGLALRQAGEFEDAERALLDCVAIDPDHGKALVNLARVRLDLERATEAGEAARQAVTLDAENGAAQRVLARVLHTQGLRTEAEETYLAAIAIDADDAWSLNNLGLLRIEEERFEEAIAPLERACGVDAGQARFFNNLGVALERTNRFRAAEEAYRTAMGLEPSSPKAEVSLARVEVLGGPVDEPSAVLAAARPEADLAAGAPVEVAEAGPAPQRIPESSEGDRE